MSLVSLTFGDPVNIGCDRFYKPMKQEFQGFDAGQQQANASPGSVENTIKIRKVTRFYGLQEFLVVGDVLKGSIKVGMNCNANGIEGKVLEVESKYGRIANKGLVGIMVIGLNPESLQPEQELSFH